MSEEIKVWTKQDVIDLLDRSDKAVARAIMVIFSRQTDSERAQGETVEHNGVGFTAFDAPFLTSLAERLPQYGNRMTERQLVVARKKIRKYWRQLLEEIESRGKPVSYKVTKSRNREIATSDTPHEPVPAPLPEQGRAENPAWGMF